MSIQESYKLPKVGRGHIVVDGTEIPMIGDVQRVGSEAEVVSFAVFTFEVRNPKRAVSLEVE